MLLLPEGQMGEVWEPSDKSCALAEIGGRQERKGRALFSYFFRLLRKCLENYETLFQQGRAYAVDNFVCGFLDPKR
jgi:hypothetical protein